MTNNSIVKSVFLLAPMTVAFAFAMDVYVPAVPRMTDLFHTTDSMMQLTLSLFMFTGGIAQLVLGPLCDRFGRRRLSFISIFCYALGAVLCALSNNVGQLILFRIIEAIGATGMCTLSFTIVRDLHEGRESAKVYSYLNGIMAFSPMFAPFIGSYLDIHYDWPATFIFLLIFPILAFLNLYFYVPETLKSEHKKALSLAIFIDYIRIFKNRQFFYYTLATAFGLSYLFIFCSLSSYVIIKLLHVSEMDYGFFFAFMGVSFFLGSFISARLVGRFGIYMTVYSGFIVSLTGALIMLVWLQITGLTLNNFIWPMLLIGIGGTFGLGAGTGGAMQPFASEAGTASALSGALRFLFAAIVGMIGINQQVNSTLPLLVPALVFNTIGLITFYVYRKTLRD